MDSSLDVGAVWRGGGFLDVGTGNVGGGSASNNGVNSLGGGDDVLLNNDVYKQKLRSAFIEQQNSLISGRHRNSQTRYSASRPTMGLGTPRSLQQQQQQPAVGWQPAAAAVQRTTQNNHQDYSIDVAAIQSSRATAAVGVTGRQFVERSGLYRSNSSLELQRGASADVDDDNVAIVPMRRDFGSDNSLDMVDSRNPNFPAIVQNYRINLEGLDANGISDERTTNANAAAGLVAVASKSPPSSGHGQMQATNEAAMSYSGPPPEIQGASMSTNGISPRVEITSDVSSSQLSMGNSDKGSRLKRSQKSKSERKAQTASDAFTSAATPATGGGNSSSSSSSGGIFRKLRGVKSDPSAIGAANRLAPDSADRNPKVEERQRRKAFNHYDCQSIGVSLADVIKRRTASEGGDSGSVRRTNTTTGASAASGQQVIGNSESGGGGSSSSRLQSPEDLTAAAAVDQGDGKSNELVQSCLNFLNELGGEEERAIWIGRKRTNQSDSSSSPSPSAAACRNGLTASQFDLINNPSCNGVCILDASAAPLGTSKSPAPMLNNYVLEYIDQGAYYYRNFFNEYDHQNYFGIDDSIGPVAVSIRRERSFVAHDDRGHNGSNGEVPASTSKSDSSSSSTFQYRIIVRTSELTTLRGSILEDCIPSTSKLSSARGLSPKDILEYVVPSLNTSCLRHAVSGSKDQLQKLDEQRLSKMYKIGIMLCRAEQSTEEEMYNNECSTPLFDEFLDFIGKRVLLKNFEKYRGGLDHKTDSTGLHSVYASFEDYEIMFHVSTLLPFTPNNRQQLLRKRHIGNDIVTIVFQEPGALPFTPKSVRSQFQHVFIIVRAMCSDGGPTKYSVAVSRLKNVPYFGPPFSKETVHEKTDSFRDFLLAKAINAENAVHCTDKFIEMATRTRRAYLQDLASNCVTAATVDTGSRLGKFSLGSGRKKDKSKLCCIPDVCSKSAVVWSAAVEDDSIQSIVDCFFAVAHDIIVIVEDQTRKVIFTTLCKAVIGWTALHEESILRIYYNQGECVTLHMARSAGVDEIKEIISRLEYVSDGCKTEDLRLQRSSNGQLGFHVGHDGVVTNVEPHGSAAAAGLRPNSRLVCVCERFVATLSHEQVIDLLRTEKHISITYVPPRDDGRVRSATRDHLEFGSHQLSAGSGEQKHDQDDNNHMSTNGDVLPPRTSAQTSPSAVYGVAALSPPGLTSIGARDTVTPYYRTPTSAYSRQAVYDNGYVWNELNQGPPPLPMPPSNVNLRSNAYHGSEQTIPASADGQLNFYPAYSRESMKGPSHKFDASQSSSKTGCSSAPRISTTSSSRPSTATESGRPVPPPKPIFASDDPGLTVSTLGRYSKRNPPDVRGLGADWHSGSSPESVARRYGSEHDTTVNSSDELHSSRGELPRQDQFAGHRQGSVTGMSSPASQCSSSTGSMRHGSSRQLWSNHDLATTSDRHEQHSTSPLLLEPMSRSRTLTHRSSPNRLPTSASGTFNSEVMRPNAMANNDIHRTLSDKSNRRSGVNFDGSNGSTGHLSTDSDQRSNQRTNIDIPGTAYRLRANPSALTHNNLPKVGNLPLPDGPAENIDWNSLVAAAKKTFEGSDNANTSSVGGGTLKASRSVDLNNSMTAINRESPRDRLDSHNLQDIANDNLSAVKRHYEARIDDLERQLDKERQEREFLENEMNGLRQQNARLLEESQAAAAQLRRFSGWFFNTIDKR